MALELNEINVSDYLDNETIDKMEKDTTGEPELIEKIRVILSENLGPNKNNIIYLPQAIVDVDGFVGKNITYDGNGSYSTKIIGDNLFTTLTDKDNIDKLKFKNCCIDMSLFRTIDSIVNLGPKKIIFEDCFIKRLIANPKHTAISFTFDKCEFTEESEVNIDGGVDSSGIVKVSNSKIEGVPKSIKFKEFSMIQITDFQSDELVTLDIENSDVTDIVSTNIKYNPIGESNITELKSIKIFKEQKMDVAFKLLDIKTNMQLYVPIGVRILDMNLDQSISNDGSSGSSPTSYKRQTDYIWFIKVEKLFSNIDDVNYVQYTATRSDGYEYKTII